jgi:hypothetical protein
MNFSGKERIAKVIGQTITTFSTSGNPPMSLKWEEVPLATPTVETKMGFIRNNDDSLHKNAARSSCRLMTPLITRNEDFFMGNMHIKNSVVDCSVSSDNYVRFRQTCECDQNICDLNTCEVQKTKLIIGKEDKCTGTEQRHEARKLNINNTMEDYNCGMLQGCLRMITKALQQLTIFIARLVVQVYSGKRVVEQCALVTQAEVYWFHSQAKVLTGGGDLREEQVDVPLSVSHSCV